MIVDPQYWLNRVVHVELDWVRRCFITHHFSHLEFDEAIDLIVFEYATSLEELAILVERLQSFTKRTANSWDLLEFLGRQIVQILVHSLTWVDLVLDTVKTSHQQGCEAEIWVRCWIREADFKTL
ncbi:hypothetical protein D9M69_628060 [compost metagenome]